MASYYVSLVAAVVMVVIVVSVLMGNNLLVAAHDHEFETTTNSTVWTPGRITQVTLAVIESALLTFILLFPDIMDPIVNFINRNIGGAGSRRRRQVQGAMEDQAAALYEMFLNAVEKFEDMHNHLSMSSL